MTIKPLGGIAGDMFVGACADLWPDLIADCDSDLKAIELPSHVSTAFEPVRVNGFAARKFRVEAAAERIVPTGAYPEIVARLDRSDLDRAVLKNALSMLAVLGEAEATAHGKPIEAVHFHELADWDSIVDLVAAASFVTRAPATRWTIDPLPLGGGTVETAHGRVPVPAPAVLELLRGFAFIDDGVPGERVTPTGAAIVRHLAEPGCRSVGGGLIGVGYGAGDKRFDALANLTQLVAFSNAPVGDRRAAEAPIVELAFDVDDMTGEEIATALERLRAIDGLLDATQTAQIGKKGRAITLIRLLCAPAAVETIVERCFLETSTLGVRLNEMRRRTLRREARQIGPDPVKLAARPGGQSTAKIEADALVETGGLAARRRRAQTAEDAAIAREMAQEMTQEIAQDRDRSE